MFHRTTARALRALASLAMYCLLLSTAAAQSRPVLSVQVRSAVATLTVSGDSGSPCTIQYTTNLTGQWFTLTNYTLPATTGTVADAAAATNRQRFYRAVLFAPSNCVWLTAGSFVMGSPTNEAGRATAETQHTVILSKGFYMGRFLVTQTNYFTLTQTNPSYFTPAHSFTADPNRPVEQVSWFEASNYCARLTLQERAAGRIFSNWSYRLPTESEWEYACRAGTSTPFYLGNTLSSGTVNFDGEYEYVGGTGTVFNPDGIFLGRTTAVGSFAPNAAGLYDVAGNVWEWCADWLGTYPTGTVTDPQGPTTGTARVFRGGALNSTGAACRSASRNSYDPSLGFNTVGFRVVLSAP